MVAAEVDEVLGCELDYASLKHPRFCVFVNVENGWVIEVESTTLMFGVFSKPLCYDSLPIRCRLCLSTEHLICGCKEILRKKCGLGVSTRPQPGSGLGHYTLRDVNHIHYKPNPGAS